MILLIDEPGKPSTPEVTDWDVDRVNLEWEPPANVCYISHHKFFQLARIITNKKILIHSLLCTLCVNKK